MDTLTARLKIISNVAADVRRLKYLRKRFIYLEPSHAYCSSQKKTGERSLWILQKTEISHISTLLCPGTGTLRRLGSVKSEGSSDRGLESGLRNEVSIAASAVWKITYHASMRAGEVINHSSPGASGTSAPTNLSAECKAVSRAKESSVLKTSPTVGKRDSAVLIP